MGTRVPDTCGRQGGGDDERAFQYPGIYCIEPETSLRELCTIAGGYDITKVVNFMVRRGHQGKMLVVSSDLLMTGNDDVYLYAGNHVIADYWPI
ncbi:MAG: hypothetical protein AAGF10_01115 [Verrucomicrobiota bacterium]